MQQKSERRNPISENSKCVWKRSLLWVIQYSWSGIGRNGNSYFEALATKKWAEKPFSKKRSLCLKTVIIMSHPIFWSGIGRNGNSYFEGNKKVSGETLFLKTVIVLMYCNIPDQISVGTETRTLWSMVFGRRKKFRKAQHCRKGRYL